MGLWGDGKSTLEYVSIYLSLVCEEKEKEKKGCGEG
jgi:hypothetical protein